MTIEEAKAFRTLVEYFQEAKPGEDILKAFDTIRSGYTRIVGQLMLLCVKTGPAFEEDEED